jgi:hypothetical protein
MVDGLVRWRRKEFSWVVLKKDQTSEKVKNSVVDRLYQTKKKNKVRRYDSVRHHIDIPRVCKRCDEVMMKEADLHRIYSLIKYVLLHVLSTYYLCLGYSKYWKII